MFWIAAVSFGVCTVKDQLRLTVSAMKSVIETKEDVIKLENLVRQELLELLQTGKSCNNHQHPCYTVEVQNGRY
jgi:hypothetical protein